MCTKICAQLMAVKLIRVEQTISPIWRDVRTLAVSTMRNGRLITRRHPWIMDLVQGRNFIVLILVWCLCLGLRDLRGTRHPLPKLGTWNFDTRIREDICVAWSKRRKERNVKLIFPILLLTSALNFILEIIIIISWFVGKKNWIVRPIQQTIRDNFNHYYCSQLTISIVCVSVESLIEKQRFNILRA